MKNLFSKMLILLSVFILLSCSPVSQNKKTEPITITINSPQGVSVLSVSDNGLINRAISNSNEMGIVKTRNYNYDDALNLRSVDVHDNSNNAYTISYGTISSNTERSIVEDQENIPSTVRYITKTHISGNRAASSNITDVEKMEYYYDENGELVDIMRIDSNGNVFAKDRD